MGARSAEIRLAAACGIVGPLLLVAYFVAPAVLGWPYAGASPATLTRYALDHSVLFYAGAWLQATGTLLSVIFFLALLRFAGAIGSLSGLALMVTATSLLAVVLVEASLLVAVPMAATAADTATVSTTFALSNGPFVRVFPLAPSSATYVALGLVLLGSAVLARPFAYAALALGAAFEVIGVAAIFSSAALIVLAVLAAVQALWILAAAIGLWRWAR